MFLKALPEPQAWKLAGTFLSLIVSVGCNFFVLICHVSKFVFNFFTCSGFGATTG